MVTKEKKKKTTQRYYNQDLDENLDNLNEEKKNVDSNVLESIVKSMFIYVKSNEAHFKC